jgi:hypothetical protein
MTLLKQPRWQSRAIQRLAHEEGIPCQLMLVPCHGDVVLAHLRNVAVSGGMSMKPHDYHGIYACDACHRAMGDRPTHETALIVLQAYQRTIHEMMQRHFLPKLEAMR